MDGIDGAQRLLIEPFSPAVGIIVDPDRRAAPAHVDMVSQREVAEAKIARHVGEGAGKRLLRFQFANIPDKRIYTTEHPPLRLCRDVR